MHPYYVIHNNNNIDNDNDNDTQHELKNNERKKKTPYGNNYT